jgi:hypothetical protein
VFFLATASSSARKRTKKKKKKKKVVTVALNFLVRFEQFVFSKTIRHASPVWEGIWIKKRVTQWRSDEKKKKKKRRRRKKQ